MKLPLSDSERDLIRIIDEDLAEISGEINDCLDGSQDRTKTETEQEESLRQAGRKTEIHRIRSQDKEDIIREALNRLR